MTEGNKKILVNGFLIESNSIADLLINSEFAVFTAATIGDDIDAVSQKMIDKGDIVKAMLIDSAGTLAVEDLSNKISKPRV